MSPMKNPRKMAESMIASAAAILCASTVIAKTDISEKIQQLKTNSENSKVNLKQYEEGIKTVNANLVEIEKAIQEIERQKQDLSKQQGESKRGKAGIDTVKAQIKKLSDTERERLKIEEKQIEEIKQALAKTEAATLKRRENIAIYEEKSKKLEVEFATWSERDQSIVELEQALGTKETQARSDNKRLIEKKGQYEEEIVKWKKQVRVSEREYRNFSKLGD